MAIQIEKRKPVSLIAEEPGLNHLIAGLGWDTAVVNGHPVDLDLSLFMLGKNGKLLADEYFVFLQQQHEP